MPGPSTRQPGFRGVRFVICSGGQDPRGACDPGPEFQDEEITVVKIVVTHHLSGPISGPRFQVDQK
jgi:hypothetical protein